MVSTLASSSKAVQWSGGLGRMWRMWCKTTVRWRARLWRVSWRLVLLKISPSSHLHSHSGCLLLRVSLCLAGSYATLEYSSSRTLHTCIGVGLALWEGLDSNSLTFKNRSRTWATTSLNTSSNGFLEGWIKSPRRNPWTKSHGQNSLRQNLPKFCYNNPPRTKSSKII